MKRTALLAAALATVLLSVFASSATADVQVCTPGGTAGHCTSPRGVAVDFETGNLYVADNGNDRIDVFKSNGKENGTPASFPATDPVWIAVDNAASSPSRHDVYLSSGFAVKKFTPSGTPAGEFGEQGDGTPEGCQLEREDDPIAVGPNGVVYVADRYDKGGSDFVGRIVKFDAGGSCIGEVVLFESPTLQFVNDLAVDSSGAIYVTVAGAGGAIRKYDPSGTLLKQFELLETSGLAVDDSDNLFAEQRGEDVRSTESTHFFTEYDTSGAIVRRFNYASGQFQGSPALAARQSPDGTLYESNQSSGVHYFSLPSPGPAIFPKPCRVKAGTLGSVRATLQAEVNPEGKATTIKAEYLTQAQWEAGGFTNPGVKVVEEPLSGPADFELHEAALKAEPLEAETKYHCRFVATNADSGPEGTIGEEGTFETGPPFEFGPAWSTDVTQTTATINAEGNPKGFPATGQIEYVSDADYQASGFAQALSTPTPPLDYGAGEEMVLRSADLSGLTPGTLYHYRLRANNGVPPEGIVCPGYAPSCPALEHTFRTFAAEAPQFDSRGYELVSPGQKNSAEVGGPPTSAGVVESRSILIDAAAPSGEAITYTSWISFGDAQGAPATSQYLSKRTPGGWETDNISPFGFQSNLFVPPYLGFSADLRFGAFKAGEVSLAEDCSADFENFYLHEADSGATRCLTPEAPNTTRRFNYCFLYGGSSEDGSRVFFQAADTTVNARYANAPASGSAGANLYEVHDGQIHLVSVLPGETPASAGISSFGMRSNEGCQTGQTVLHHAISADGSKVIWTQVAAPPYGPSQLLDRIGGSETVQLDKKQTGSGESGNGTYWAASKDGSVVYFTSPNRLLSGVRAEAGAEDLYRYDFSKSPESARLTDLTVKGTAPGAVRGVLGASEDGQVIYYVAGSALTPESEANEAGQHADAGKNNLYVYDAMEGKNHFIAVLSKEDFNDWETQPKVQTARVSPDGEHLAFLSVEAQKLAGYDNTLVKSAGRFGGGAECRLGEGGILTGSTLCPQAFLYDNQSQELTCASCNPSGARPLGPATLPGWTNMAEGPHYLSDDGSRFFFESFDRLLPADESPKRDVYEFERSGSGSCDAANSNFISSSGGCLFLVSGGKSSDENHLIDASADGRDAFFSTRAKLTGWDVNENFDIYDYREGGGFPEPVEEPICRGEACKPPASAVPSFNAPPHFEEPISTHKKPKKHKHKKKSKAKKKPHAKKKGARR